MADRAPPNIFSRSRRIAAANRATARQSGPGAARFVIDDMLDDFGDRMGFMRLEPAAGLLVTPFAVDVQLPGDIAQVTQDRIDEAAPLSEGPFDFIANCGSLATVNDLPGALLHVRQALEPGGIAMLSLVGAGSCANLRRAMLAAEPDRPAARMHPLVDNRAATALLERAGFTRFVVDSRVLEVSYRFLDRLVADLRDQGLGNQLTSHATPLGKSALELARAAFLSHADEDGRVIETFDILTLTGWR